MQTPTLLAAFLFGLVSFLSPCVFPLIPAYIGYLSGPAVMANRPNRKPGMRRPNGQMEAGRRPVASGTAAARAGGPPTTVQSVGASGAAATMPVATVASPARGFSLQGFFSSPRWVVMAHAFLFVAGFSFVFVVVIGGLAGGLSIFLQDNKRWVQYISGVILVIFGLHSMGLIRISFLDYTRRLDVRPSNNLGYFRSLLIGLGFGAGWTPCIGGPLTAMFTLALTGQQATAFPLFLAYSLGLGIPFLIVAAAMGQVSAWLKKVTRRTFTVKIGSWTVIDQVNIIAFVSGVLLIVMGYLVFTNALTILSTFAPLIDVPVQ